MSSPPVSKQTPLPTSVTFGASSRPQTRSSSRGGSAAAAPTASIIGRFAALSAAAPRDHPRPRRRAAAASATKAASSASGPMSRAGVLIRSCASRAAPAIRSIRAGVDALGADERATARLAGAVAVEAVVGHQPAERLQPRRRAPPRPAPSASVPAGSFAAAAARWKRSRARASGAPQPASAPAIDPSGAGRHEHLAERRPRSPRPAPRRASPRPGSRASRRASRARSARAGLPGRRALGRGAFGTFEREPRRS